ncbi:MAG: LacI family transcriptional regulator [Candidatus Accumulibacter sp.]|jgi:DNA-binding LacI/PurR family transcriptional regulator|nr:LacI family transcriptional regulator [Accumulibacter sp.]
MQRITIQHVAKAAGVSVSSVSHYQNGRYHHLRPETIERIRKCIAELGYSPSRVALQLKSGQTPMVGLLVPSIDNPYHADLALALDQEALKAGLRPVLGNGQRDAAREKAFIDELIEYGVRGFISTSELRDAAAMSEYVKRGIAFALFDLRLVDIGGLNGIDVVSINNALATSRAVDHLAALGHRRIAFLTTPPSSANRTARLDGYVAALERNGLSDPLVISIKDDENTEIGDSGLAGFAEKAAEKLLESYPGTTAVIGINSIVTIGICAGLQQLGVKVPKDISLIGVDNIKLSSMMVPTITSLGADYGAMAAQAVEYLRTRLAAPSIPGRETIYVPELIVRQSTTVPSP